MSGATDSQTQRYVNPIAGMSGGDDDEVQEIGEAANTRLEKNRRLSSFDAKGGHTDNLFLNLADKAGDAELGDQTCIGRVKRFNLDPDGQFRRTWDLGILILVMYSSTWEPYKAAYLGDKMAIWEWLLDMCYWADIVLTFFTGYMDNGYQMIKDKKLIAKRYFKFWFWLDILATFPWDYAVLLFIPDFDAELLRMVRMIRVLRLLRASRIIHRLTASWTIHTSFVEAAKFFMYATVIAHLLACMFWIWPALFYDASVTTWRVKAGMDARVNGTRVLCVNASHGYFAGGSAEECFALSFPNSMGPSGESIPACKAGSYVDGTPIVDHWTQYSMSLYWAITTMTTIGYGDITPVQEAEVLFTIFAMLLGVSFFALLVTQINELNRVAGGELHHYEEVKNDLVSYMKDHSVNPSLIQRIVEYLNFRASSHAAHSFNDQDPRLESLSGPLRKELRVTLFEPIVKKLKMFGWNTSKVDDKDLRALFDEIDADGGGTLDEEEMKELIIGMGQSATDEDVTKLMTEMDEEGDGEVSFEQFRKWWKNKESKVTSLPK